MYSCFPIRFQMQVDKNCNATVTAPNNQITTTRAGNVIPSNGKFPIYFRVFFFNIYAKYSLIVCIFMRFCAHRRHTITTISAQTEAKFTTTKYGK